jgi:hypothetical protein
MRVALINTNRMQPPVVPIGLDYIAEALHAAGQSVELLNLCWEENPQSSITRFLRNSSFGLIGLTLRNTDDCAFTNRQSFLPWFVDLIRTIRENSDAPTVLGGVGFSVMPEAILSLTNADFGMGRRRVCPAGACALVGETSAASADRKNESHFSEWALHPRSSRLLIKGIMSTVHV